MRRNDLKLLLDVLLLAAAALTFAAGLVLLTRFHMHLGPFRQATLGISRLAWLNLHRLSALATAEAAGAHLVLDWKPFVGWLRRAFGRGRGAGVELVFYAAFWTVALTGLAAWFAVDGSTPLGGPVALGFLPRPRHALVDVHDVAGLLALALTIHHTAHRWRTLARGLGAMARRARGAPPATPAREIEP